jgi:hypothetical protein
VTIGAERRAVVLNQRVACGSKQVAEPERFRQPAASGLFEKAPGFSSGSIAGDEMTRRASAGVAAAIAR